MLRCYGLPAVDQMTVKELLRFRQWAKAPKNSMPGHGRSGPGSVDFDHQDGETIDLNVVAAEALPAADPHAETLRLGRLCGADQPDSSIRAGDAVCLLPPRRHFSIILNTL